MEEIRWEGNFRTMDTKQEARAKEVISDFLEQANLVCIGMSVVGYDFDYVSDVPMASIQLDALPDHNNHVDLTIGMGGRNPHVKVRVMWHCSGRFPMPMGIPDHERIKRAIREFNNTGSVTTKESTLHTIPAYAAAMVLGVAAIMSDNYPHRRRRH